MAYFQISGWFNMSFIITFHWIIGTGEYNVVAEIRQNSFGRENLFHNNYKFNKNGKSVMKQLWLCTKHRSERCKASASTMEIDGVVMMKVLKAEHTHEADQ